MDSALDATSIGATTKRDRPSAESELEVMSSGYGHGTTINTNLHGDDPFLSLVPVVWVFWIAGEPIDDVGVVGSTGPTRGFMADRGWDAFFGDDRM